jgi:hypothetical protein
MLPGPSSTQIIWDRHLTAFLTGISAQPVAVWLSSLNTIGRFEDFSSRMPHAAGSRRAAKPPRNDFSIAEHPRSCVGTLNFEETKPFFCNEKK